MQHKRQKDSHPSLADQEIQKLQIDKAIGHREKMQSGADEERLDWDDDGDEEALKRREEEEYSFAQKDARPRKSAADEEVKELRMQKAGGRHQRSNPRAGVDEERLDWDDDGDEEALN